MRGGAILAIVAGTGLALTVPSGLAAQGVPAPAPAPAPAPSPGQPGASDAVAGYQSAGDLLRKCRQNSSYAKNFCFAYLAAVADSSRSYRVWIGAGDPCLPPGLTLGRLADTFEAYLINNPSLTEAQAASVIVASLQESFPCPKLPPVPPPAPVLPTIPAPAPQPGTVALRTPVTPSQQRVGNEIDARPQGDRRP
jgi:hypothetical protein